MTDKERENLRVYNRLYKENNRERINENQRKRRKLNPEKVHQYYLNAKAKKSHLKAI